MTAHFRKAITSEAKPLIGLYSESGCGKTKSALLLAKGFCGDMSKVGMIETEAGRGEAYANEPDIGGYNVLSIRAEFSPTTYGEAISAAEKADLQCLIVDSASHEWEGLGGVLGMAAQNQADGKKGPLVWQKPKMDHARQFMLRLTQTPIPLVIVCMRAKYPMKEVKHSDIEWWEKSGQHGKPPKLGEWIRSSVLEPKQSEDILYEMFVHGWIDKEHCFHGTKYTLDKLRGVFLDSKPITIETGQRLAEWASGQTNNGATVSDKAPATVTGENGSPTLISPDQVTHLGDLLRDNALDKAAFCKAAHVESLAFLPAEKYQAAVDRINAAIEKRRSAA